MDEKFLYLAKAREDLQGAQSEFLQKRYNNAANRAYYACFHAAIAALLDEGITASKGWGHSFVQGMFGGVLVRRRKVYADDASSILPKNERTRLNADYAAESISQRDAQRALARAEQFTSMVFKQVEGAADDL